MKPNIPTWLWTGITTLLPLIAITILAGCNAMPTDTPTPAPDFSTPPSDLSSYELVEWDFAYGNITKEQRILYLHYAFYDYKNLPDRYHSGIGVDETPQGELYSELSNLVDSGEICKFSPYTLSELNRIIGLEVSCNNSNRSVLTFVLVSCGTLALIFVCRKKIINFLNSLKKPQN